jgi:2-polyprenyl-6-methoxyphenol hydroxylase-like FAD-dependent oxidoreductase
VTRRANDELQIKNILISGASAAGPSLAFWLHHYGFNPMVVERAPSLRAGGYAIDLRGTAVHVAERMGILAEARKASTDLREVLFVDSKNETVATMDANFGAGPGKAGDVELLRDDLAQILYAATKDNIDYIFGDSIASLSQHDAGVDVIFERGATRTFDLVIGADGSHSNVRGLSFGEESQFSHYLGQHVAIFTIPNYLNLDRLWLMHYVPKKMAAIMQTGHTSTRGPYSCSPRRNWTTTTATRNSRRTSCGRSSRRKPDGSSNGCSKRCAMRRTSTSMTSVRFAWIVGQTDGSRWLAMRPAAPR